MTDLIEVEEQFPPEQFPPEQFPTPEDLIEDSPVVPDDTIHGRSYINPVYKPNGDSYQLAALRPRHLAIMDFMLAHVTLPYGQVAAHFGVSQSWLSTVINSDLFQARLAERRFLMEGRQREELNARLLNLADKSLTSMEDALADEEIGVKTKLEIGKLSLAALGYLGPSAKNNATSPQQTTNVAVTVSVVDDAIAAARARLTAARESGLLPARAAISGQSTLIESQ